MIFHFFLRHNCNKSPWKNIFLVSLHSRPSPLVCAPPQPTIFSSPTSFLLCPFLSAIPSTTAQFARKIIYNAFNALSTSSIILAEEGDPPICESHISFSPRDIYLGVDELKRTILSSSLVTSPSKIQQLKALRKRKDFKMLQFIKLSKGMNLGLLPTGRPA